MFGDPNSSRDTVPFEVAFTIRDDLRKPINDAVRAEMHDGATYPYYGANGQVDIINQYLMDCTALCLAEDCGAYGPGEPSSYIVQGKCWVNNHAHVIIPNDNCDLHYANAFFRILDMRPYVSGSTRLKLTQGKMKEIPVVLPLLDEQKQFARFIEQTDKSKFIGFKSQFIEMFGELDKNTKRFPVRKLSEISSYWNGLTYKPADAVEDGTGTLVLRSSNIQNGALAFEDNVYVNCEIKEKLLVQENDILMCSRNGSAALVGKTALIKGLVEPTTFGAFMMIIRSEYYSYLKTYFEMPFFRNQISTGTSTINQITGKMLNEISLPVPDMDTVRMFESFVHQSDKSK